MSTLREFLNKNIDLFNLFLYKKINKKTLRDFSKNNELKQQIILVSKLLNINQDFKLFMASKPIDYVSIKTLLKARYRRIRPKRFEGISNIHVIYRSLRLRNPLSSNLSDLSKSLRIYMMAVELEENGFFILIDDKLVGEIVNKFDNFNEVKIKPLYMRKYMEKSGEKVTKMKILVGGEIGGIDGLFYIILEGNDVIRGVENFYRRYKSQTLRFHMIGALNEISFESGLALSSDGKIRVVSVVNLLNFLRTVIQFI